jgi:molybdate transport system substrate-binding protein
MTQVTVIISGGFSGPYRQLLPGFEGSSGISVTTLSGASQGKGPETIAAQLERGVDADVVILSREGLTELIAAGRIVAGTDVDLATAALGAAVRAGARRPEIGTVPAFKQALLDARVVAVPASTSGIYLTTELFPRLGIADRINTRVMPRGSQSAGLVAAGEADIAVQPTSELVREPGLDYLGPIPDELQLVQTFCAAIVAGSKKLEASRALIAFLAAEGAAGAISSSGMQPVSHPAPPGVLGGRVVLGFVAAALGVPALVAVTSPPNGLFWFAMISLFTVPLTVFAGMPLFVWLARRRRVTFWWCMLAGLVIGAAGVLLFMLVTNVLAARNWAPLLIVTGLLCSFVFWLAGVWKNRALDRVRR